MASNQIQMGVNFRKNINSKSAANGKYYAEVDRQKTLTTRGLAAHLKEHNCMVGRDAIQAVLVKLSECIPELVAQGVGVKLDGLGIFYPTIRNKKGGATEEQMLDSEFNPTSIVEGVHVRFLPESSTLDNLTSRQFMTRSVSTASQNIVKVEKRTVNGKVKNVQVVQSLADFRTANAPKVEKRTVNGKVKNVQVVQSLADFRTANAPSNSGGGPLPVGGDTEIDPDDGD